MVCLYLEPWALEVTVAWALAVTVCRPVSTA
jgi:hypothetical protein